MATSDYNDEELAALRAHGYDTEALPSGVSASAKNPDPTRTWPGKSAVRKNGKLVRLDDCTLRYWVCFLDGIMIDGHAGSDLDPGDTTCIHCGYDWYDV